MEPYPEVTWIAGNGADRPSFSADGTRIVYQDLNGGGLYIVSATGGAPSLLLAATSAMSPTRPDWSWSPETIAFGAQTESGSTICLIDSDGCNLVPLKGMGSLSHSTYPSWYESREWIVVVDSGNPRYHALWRLTVDGSAAPVQLTSMDDFCAGRPSVAPGGELAPVAFAGTRGPYNQQNNQVWIVNPPSRDAAQLDPAQGRSPNWSPDGKWILFESSRGTGTHYQIFVAPAPGAVQDDLQMAPRALTDPSYFSQHAEWSRQQDRIVFERGNGEALGVFEVPEEFRAS